MWKKNRSAKEREIGNPTLLATTFDNTALRNMTSINTPANREHRANDSHSRQERGHHSGPGLPPLPFKSMEPTTLRRNPPSRPAVTSSIYSERDSYPQPEPDLSSNRYNTHPSGNHKNYQTGYRDSKYTDISPPNSPIFIPSGYRESPDVSPIDEPLPQFPPPKETRLATALPVPPKDVPTKTNTTVQAPSQPYELPPPPTRLKLTSPREASNRLTRWDDFSGEPTESEKGKVAQVIPGSIATKQSPTTKQTSKQGFNFRAKGKELNQARKKIMEGRRQADKDVKVDKDDPARIPPPREPWKGASGRTAIVNPIETKKALRAQPLSIQTRLPPRKDSRQGVERKMLPTTTVSISREGDHVTPTIKPVVPLKAGNNTTTSSKHFLPPASSSGSGPPAQSEAPKTIHQATPGLYLATMLQDINLEQQPSSRFSATTYAPTEPANSPPGTPRPRIADKDAPPVPYMAAGKKKPLSQTFTKVMARKPTPSEVSTWTAKTLPRSPPEMEAGNRIDAMEAKMNDLARRKDNINTIIHELTQVIQPSSIAYDIATRSEVKKSVTSLNNELLEIRKEEHDVGMKLMRARKKQDQEEFYQPSSIWIKRVTEDY
ncbi:hypothetical protein ACO22_03353 [Paracoccidioides brasiliensis]|uniref:Uncharacterized protein n=1 Tax=Paracoccidioides brasiliensis TaxID=121759 RepID=A0A1D2JGA0_PARBR|nr:hypothetical protein ACO22_03353 [Paracoccidioides brasiliensis]ODH53425.1 hypothetical protein GX48_00255 [Paracoccidioides brasiliensis]